MSTGTAGIYQGRSHGFRCYMQRLNESARELRLLKIGLALTLTGCLLLVVLLGKMSEGTMARTGPIERMALIFAVAFFVFYKWREQRHTEALNDIETRLLPEERSAVHRVVSTLD